MAATLAKVLQSASERVGRLDARLLAGHVCGLSHAQLITADNRALSAEENQRLERLLARRAAGEPLAYLVGEAGFFGRTLTVSPAVLVPRPETEEVVERALSWLANTSQPRILDLGTGSGAIALTLALERPDAQVVAIDLSADALVVARSNGARHQARVDWRQGNWFSAVSADERFDLIVSNPPYIAANDPHLMGDGVCVEPRLALTDGADGLDCLRAIISGSPPHLLTGGKILLEHGHDQGEAARNLLALAGFKDSATWPDLSGNDRMSGGQWFPPPPSPSKPGLTRIK